MGRHGQRRKARVTERDMARPGLTPINVRLIGKRLEIMNTPVVTWIVLNASHEFLAFTHTLDGIIYKTIFKLNFDRLDHLSLN